MTLAAHFQGCRSSSLSSFLLLLLLLFSYMLLLALTISGSLGRHYIAMFEATQNVMLKPTETWREALLDTRVMDLFFTVSDSHVFIRCKNVLCCSFISYIFRSSLLLSLLFHAYFIDDTFQIAVILAPIKYLFFLKIKLYE